MSTKHTHPAFPPQIALDQFQRPVAPIPGMTMLDYFALNIYVNKGGSYIDAIQKAKLFLDALSEYQSNENLQTLKIIQDEK